MASVLRIRRFLSNIFLLLIAVLVFFFVFEAVLRFIHYEDPFENRIYYEDSFNGRHIPSANPKVGYELVPDSSFVGNRGKLHVINSFGMRDSALSLEKAPGEFRIAVLGDSVAFGNGVEQNESFPEQLELMLSQLNLSANVSVLNFGVNGYNTLQEVEVFKDKVLGFDPDLVLVAYVLNDPFDMDENEMKDNLLKPQVDTSQCRLEYVDIRVSCGLKRFLGRSGALRFVKYRFNYLAYRVEFGDFISRLYENDTLYRKNVLTPLTELSALSQEKLNSTPVLVVFPVVSSLDQEPYKYSYIHERVLNDAQGLGFVTLDLLGTYKAYKKDEIEMVKGDFIHPSVLGHRLAADSIKEKLLVSGLLPP